MSHSSKTIVKTLLRGTAWFLFLVAALTFWAGGRMISAFTNTDRIPSEMEGLVLTLFIAALGVVAKVAEDRLDEREHGTSKSLGEALRK